MPCKHLVTAHSTHLHFQSPPPFLTPPLPLPYQAASMGATPGAAEVPTILSRGSVVVRAINIGRQPSNSASQPQVRLAMVAGFVTWSGLLCVTLICMCGLVLAERQL